MKRINLKLVLSGIFGIVLGYIFYWYIGMDLAGRVLSGGGMMAEQIITIFFMLVTMVAFTFLINLAITRKVSKPLLYILMGNYVLLLLYALFYRDTLEREFILNPLIGLADLTDRQALEVSALNLLAFVPMGFFFRKIKTYGIVATITFGLAIAVELIQWFTQWGSFDSFDLIMYFIGMTAGYFFCRRFLKNI